MIIETLGMPDIISQNVRAVPAPRFVRAIALRRIRTLATSGISRKPVGKRYLSSRVATCAETSSTASTVRIFSTLYESRRSARALAAMENLCQIPRSSSILKKICSASANINGVESFVLSSESTRPDRCRTMTPSKTAIFSEQATAVCTNGKSSDRANGGKRSLSRITNSRR